MTKSALLVRMIDMLRRHPGPTMEELARDLGRSQRTIYRWLGEIDKDLNVPVSCVAGIYRLVERTAPGLAGLTAEELLALRLSLNSAPVEALSPLKSYAESAWLKIRDAAPSHHCEAAAELADSHAIHPTCPDTRQESGIVEALHRAVRNRRRLRVVYRSQKSDRVKEYTIDPYALVFRRHSWYLLAFCLRHGKVIQMKLARFKSVEEVGPAAPRSEGFSVEDYFSLSWESWAGGEPTRVRVLFDACFAEMIRESKRHRTQRVSDRGDGSVEFEVTVAGIEEIAFWIMGYGKHALVLEPENLRELIADHASALAERYEENDEERSAIPVGLTSIGKSPGTVSPGDG